MRRRATPGAGFTLLEIMISLGILGAALGVLLSLSSADVRAAHKAKLLTVATGLARGKMLDLEEELLRTGFQETAEEMEGDFEDEQQPKFTWHALIERVQLPAAAEIANAEGEAAAAPPPAAGTDAENEDKLLGLAGGSESGALGASMVQLYFPLIRPVLEAAIRKITLEVRWKIGKDEETLKVVAFYTNSKAIDEAMRAFGGGGGGTPNPTPTPNPGGGGGGR